MCFQKKKNKVGFFIFYLFRKINLFFCCWKKKLKQIIFFKFICKEKYKSILKILCFFTNKFKKQTKKILFLKNTKKKLSLGNKKSFVYFIFTIFIRNKNYWFSLKLKYLHPSSYFSWILINFILYHFLFCSLHL